MRGLGGAESMCVCVCVRARKPARVCETKDSIFLSLCFIYIQMYVCNV